MLYILKIKSYLRYIENINELVQDKSPVLQLTPTLTPKIEIDKPVIGIYV